MSAPISDFVPQLATTPEEARANLRMALDEITDNAAVLDAQGVIVMVNLAWRRYALAYSPLPGQMPSNTDVGSNYLEVSARGCDDTPESASKAINGIRSVLSGKAEAFSLRYPCHTPQQQFWFTMKVTPLDWEGQRGVLVTHADTTPQHRLQVK